MRFILLIIVIAQTILSADDYAKTFSSFNFCTDHIKKYPDECDIYDTTTLLPSSFLDQIPTINQNCDFQSCSLCKSPVYTKVLENYEFDDEFSDSQRFTCDCLDDWIDEIEANEIAVQGLEVEELDEDFDLFSSYRTLSSYWTRCQNKGIPVALLNCSNKHQYEQLKKFISYTTSNSCDCYWPYKHPLAIKINNLAYNQLDLVMKDSFVINNNDASLIKQIFPQFEELTIHGLIVDRLAQTFFYSQYRHSLLEWGVWEEKYNAENENVIKNLNRLYGIIDTISPLFIRLYTDCLKAHLHAQIYYERGMVFFHQGHYLAALNDINAFIKESASTQESVLNSGYYLTQGAIYTELGLYEKAIESLNKAIKKDPSNKQAYFERAANYFELGNIDAALSDYLSSGIKPSFDSTPLAKNLYFSIGLTQGLTEGIWKGSMEYVPSLLSTASGLGQSLWAIVEDPVQVSASFINASKEIVTYIKEHTTKEALELVVPELKELIGKWESIEDQEQGYLIGSIIGKYGIDFLATAGITKGIKIFKELKKANNLLTFEAIASSKRNQEAIKLESLKRFKTRQEILKSAKLNIEWDKQGKHISGHKFFNAKETKSILEHAEPQKLVNNYAGLGIKDGGQAGISGYKEIIDFGEYIGKYYDRNTCQYISTNWGKIHYSKNGTHIVPTKPRLFYAR